MSSLFRQSLALRYSLTPKKNVCHSLRRLMATKKASTDISDKEDAESQPKYFHGKRIVDEVQDPYKMEYVLLSITGYDSALLDSYVKSVQIAATMTDLNISKSFNLPAIPESFNARKGNSELRKDHIIYKLKKHQRIIQVTDVSEDKCDVFLDYIHQQMPCGVQLQIEEKRWEELVAPNHPSLQKIDQTVSRYQKQ